MNANFKLPDCDMDSKTNTHTYVRLQRSMGHHVPPKMYSADDLDTYMQSQFGLSFRLPEFCFGEVGHDYLVTDARKFQTTILRHGLVVIRQTTV